MGIVQLTSEKSSVAWFRLAECVGRKEKERAFLMLHLLMHALSDKAYAAQLEGDLLWAFKDERAIEVYRRAITMYEETQRLREAAQIYERLLLITGPQVDSLTSIVGLYQTLGQETKMTRYAVQLMWLLVQEHQYDRAKKLVTQWKLSPAFAGMVHEALVFALVEQPKTASRVRLEYHLQKTIENFCKDIGGKHLSAFLIKLSVVDHDIHRRACALLEKIPQL